MRSFCWGQGFWPNILPFLTGLTSFSLSFFGERPNSSSSLLIIGIWILFGLLCWFFERKGLFKVGKLGLIPVLVPCLLTSFIRPPFENDFYRYFFEGQVLMLGENPYLLSPLDLMDKLSFSKFFNIGYPSLSGVYPPLVVLIFGILGFGSFKLGLILFSLLNGLLIFWFMRIMDRTVPLQKGAVGLLVFFLMREMVFQFHFELLALIPFFLGLKEKNIYKRQFLLMLSFHIKLLALIPLLLELVENIWRKNIRMLFVSLLGLLLSFFLLIQTGFFKSSGLMAFSNNWFFAPGFLGWFWPLSKSFLTFAQAKGVSLSLALLWGSYFLWINRGEVFGRKGEGFLSRRVVVFTMVLFFYFSPVFNAWYALWPASLLMLRKDQGSNALLVLSPLCYLYFYSPTSWPLLTAANIVLHLPMVLYLVEESRLNSNHIQATQSSSYPDQRRA